MENAMTRKAKRITLVAVAALGTALAGVAIAQDLGVTVGVGASVGVSGISGLVSGLLGDITGLLGGLTGIL
jgi:hypothetical protein